MIENIEDEELALGIDLGTTNCYMAILLNGQVEIIPNEIEENKTSSMAYFEGNEIFVGEEIENILIKNPNNLIYNIKRLIGRDFDDIEIQKDLKSNLWTFDIVRSTIGSRLQIKIKKNNGKDLYYSPEEILGLIIKKLLKSAQKFLGKSIKKAIITVPEYFTETQINATKLAANSAGLEVLKFINEPCSACIAYGLINKIQKKKKSYLENEFCQKDNTIENDNKLEKFTFIFDLGGGTFNITLIKLFEEDEIIKVKASKTDYHLGGDNFDQKIVEYCLKQFSNIYNINTDEIKQDMKAMKRLKLASEKAKIILSMDDKTSIYIDEFYKKEFLQIKITRTIFEEIISKDLFINLISSINKFLDDEKISLSQITEVILIGGATKIPKIKELLTNYFYDININDSINNEETVAYGAAILASKIINKKSDIINDTILMDSINFSLSINSENLNNSLNIENKDYFKSFIIEKGTKIPFQKSQNFTTSFDYQESIRFSVYEGDSKFAQNKYLLAKFNLENLPKKKAGELIIIVTILIDVNRICFVNAMETSQGINNSIKIINDKGGINQQELIKKINESNNSVISLDFPYEQNYKKEMNDFYECYINSINKKEKFKYICNFSNSIVNYLNALNFEDTIFLKNKYYLYIKTLFNSYNIGLNLTKMVTDDYIKEIINNSKNYINLLASFKNINYQYFITLLNFFKIENRNNILYDIVVLTIEILAIKADNILLGNKMRYIKYQSKYLYNNCLKIGELFIKSDKSLALLYPEIRKGYNKCIEKCKNKIKKINADSLKEICLIKNSKKLFQNNTTLNREMLLFLLDNFRTALQNIEGTNDSESEAIYISNIVKINYSYLKNENYSQLKKSAEQSINLIKSLNENNNNNNWFKEILYILDEINKKIKEKQKKEDEDFEENLKKEKAILDEIKEYRKNKSNIEFIEFILKKYPPKKNNILKNNQTVKEKWDNNKDKFLLLLFKKYHPDNFYKNTKEEKLKYTIYNTIAIEINSIREEKNS